MITIQDHYDTYPYPERDPAEERRRLVTGSPSRPVEMDHRLWGGRRDWSKPLNALVAGGGSGDGLVQLAQLLTDAKRPYRITYLDLSPGARKVAEARVKVRGLTGIEFHTGSLLDAPDYGPFDYIDCCGVLHHLPDPTAGFAALRAALSPGGGMGFMVYAPYGRSGVYPLQEAFGALFADLSPQERLAQARDLLDRVPDGHPFKRNLQVVDHQAGDAGFYDLLLHSQDQAFGVGRLLSTLEQTGWQLASFCQPGLYELTRLVEQPPDLSPADAMAIAEKLRGTLKTHVGYAIPTESTVQHPSGMARVPHLSGAPASKLAQVVAQGRDIPIKIDGETIPLRLPRETATLIAGIDGRRDLATLASSAGLDPLAANALWSRVDAAFEPWGLLHYSALLSA